MLINPAVRSVSPALRWHAENDAWVVLGFDTVEGRAADFSPGSPALLAVVGLVNRIGELDLPEVAREWPETRWERFTKDESQAALLQGDDLPYTDINPNNMMIGKHTAWAVDWSWPTHGAGFIDPACLVVQLIAAGHSPESAESRVSVCAADVEGFTEVLRLRTALLRGGFLDQGQVRFSHHDGHLLQSRMSMVSPPYVQWSPHASGTGRWPLPRGARGCRR
ncbi:hypothetical protein ACGRHY_13920 [Streptomyces sp. HK10]|uniref:hypothetical protein n=1 Tax=Streptomyces sp. HK10 TaxID=3373255 RepID=UPI00374A35E7